MDIHFKCPSCNQSLTADRQNLGAEISCPSCGESIIIQEDTSGGSTGKLSVPTRTHAPESLISKPSRPLEAAAKAAVKTSLKTIRRVDCMENGEDRFDETVSKFLQSIGEPNIVDVDPIQYTYIDKETKLPMNDYGVMVVYKG